MKRKSHSLDRQGDKIELSAIFRDKMRRPAGVKLSKATEPGIVYKGEVVEGMGMLFGLAEIAWDAGWRPRGLSEKIAGAMSMHKIPPLDDAW